MVSALYKYIFCPSAKKRKVAVVKKSNRLEVKDDLNKVVLQRSENGAPEAIRGETTVYLLCLRYWIGNLLPPLLK